MFLLNSCLSLFSATIFLWHPFSRSYGVILPSSLTILLPSALGFSPHPPVSVYGTGFSKTIAAFLGSWLMCFATYLRSLTRLWIVWRICLPNSSYASTGFPFPGSHFRPASPQFLISSGAEISTCCPSTTPSGLALGPDLPRADQLYPGNLRYSAGRIRTYLSLLIPAFSLQSPPLLLIGTASSNFQCSSTNV